MPDQRSVLEQLGRVAADLGPMLAPAGHDQLLQAITATAREMFAAAACSLALVDEDADELVFHVASGAGEIAGLRIPAGTGIAGWVAASGQPIAIDDVREDPRFARKVAEDTGYIPRAIVAMPVETDREVLGVIQILDPEPDTGRDEMALLELFARQAALAIESQRVFADLGRILLQAAARATKTGTLADALADAAGAARGPDPGLAQLAAHISELGRLGAGERDTATRLIGDVLAYARACREAPPPPADTSS
jgi:GAF domain-containing protein